MIATWMALPAQQRRMIATATIAVALANVDQPYPDLAPLQHGPTLALIIGAPWMLKRWPLSSGAVACVWLFLLAHTLGARYIYSYVPYDDWARALTGYGLSSAFGWQRNGYDRIVHFLFGALLTRPLAEAAGRFGGLARGWTLAFAFAAIGLGSAVYEIVEWLLTIVAAGGTADYYNGQQGDIWDAQKDMGVAQIGSGLAVLTCRIRSRRIDREALSGSPEIIGRKD